MYKKEILSYAGVEIPANLYTERKTWELMPSRNIETRRFGRQNGEHFLYAHDEMREFTVEFAMISPTKKDLWNFMTTVQKWLRYDNPQPMVFADRPEVYYKAILVGSSEVEEFSRLGKMTLTFVCPDPYGYGVDPVEIPFDKEGFAFVEDLDIIDSEPTIVLNPTEDITNIDIRTSEKEFMLFGKPQEEEKTYNPKRVVFEDPGTRIGNWTIANSVHEGHIDGSMKSKNNDYVVNEFGSPGPITDWHGPSYVRSFGGGLEIQDFRLEVKFSLVAAKVKEAGRVECYALDKNGVRVARMSLRVGNPAAITPYLEINLGNKEIFYGYGDRPGVWKDAQEGLFTIERQGKFWSFSIGIFNPSNGQYHSRKTVRYSSDSNPYLHRIAGVQIAMARRADGEGEGKERPPIEKMSINNIKVIEFNRPPLEPSSPVIMSSGDELRIDSNSHTITLNGLPYYEHLVPSSRFLTMSRGQNLMKISPPMPAKLIHRKRVL